MDRETLDIGDIEKELEQKSIERDIEVEGAVEIEISEEPETPKVTEVKAPVKKTKKIRSEKQIAAFEKARLKRAEGIASRKKEKEEQKEHKKELNKQSRELKKNPEVIEEQAVSKPVVQPSTTKEQVIQNHYYYYGVPPPNYKISEATGSQNDRLLQSLHQVKAKANLKKNNINTKSNPNRNTTSQLNTSLAILNFFIYLKYNNDFY